MPDVVLKLESVSKSFGTREIFTGVNLEVTAGEIVTIVGPSGVGKTTLLRAIAGMTEVEGRITIAGMPVHNCPTDGKGLSTNKVKRFDARSICFSRDFSVRPVSFVQ